MDANSMCQLFCSFKAEGYAEFMENNKSCVIKRQFRVSEKLVSVWSEKTAELQSRFKLHRSKKKIFFKFGILKYNLNFVIQQQQL